MSCSLFKNDNSDRRSNKSKSQNIWQVTGRNQVPERWWESAAAIKRFSLKPGGTMNSYLSKTEKLDA